jgi:hypothetical protein
MKTRDEYGESCRGFEVLFKCKNRGLKLPCSGCAYLTGKQAIKAMETLVKRGYEPIARTTSGAIEEFLTLDEMKEVVI